MSATNESQSRPVESDTRYAISIDPAGDSSTGWSTPPETPRTRATLVGEMLGSYRVLELVGSGGMGCVYRAEHARLGRTVALKVLHEHHARRRDAALRLFQEARASSQIRHRNIVDVVDYLELDGDLVCIVMEYLPGPSLAQLMATPGALPAARALDLLAQIADGLDAAHGAGIVHRDLKPDNVVVIPDPGGGGGDLVKLLDFGVAKLASGSDGVDGGDGVDGPLTAAGQVVGTPPYMAPEQASGVGVDARTDVYALGAIMYELFTGQTPFVARTFDEYVFKHLAVAPAPPRTTPGGGDVDPRIESVIMRCLEKEPAARFGSARELGGELLAIRDALASAPPAPPDEAAPVPAFTWHGASAARPLVKRSVWAGLAVAAAALVGFAVARGVAARPAAPAPSAARARGPAVPPEGPALVRIVSEPPARVYPAGRDQAMCRTPCAIAIAPRVGRAARPTYMVRRRGYRDEAISVDPEAPPSQVRIRLERERRAPDKPTRARIGRDATLNPYRDVGAPGDRP